jgi:hypothetical protein
MYLTASGSIIAVKRERSYGVEGFLNLDGDLDAKGICNAKSEAVALGGGRVSSKPKGNSVCER